MRGRRSLILLVFALMLAIGAAWMANTWISQKSSNHLADGKTTAVIVAEMDIPFGQKIDTVHLKSIEMPKELAPAGSFRSTDEVVGKVATDAIFSGEVIIAQRVADHAGGSALAAMVDPDMRAVSVRVNDVTGVAGFLLPGNRVDVLAARKENRRSVTRTVIQNVRVLAIDQTSSPEKDKPVVVRAVTLEVSPKQSELLFQAMDEGTIQLTLRNPTDKIVAQEDGSQKKPKKVVKAPEPRASVTVIRGTAMRQDKSSL